MKIAFINRDQSTHLIHSSPDLLDSGPDRTQSNQRIMADPIENDIARATSEVHDDDYVPGGGSEEELTEAATDDGTQQEGDHPAKPGSNAELFDDRLFQVGKYLKGKDNPNLTHISEILATVGEDWRQAGLRSEHETYEHVAESCLHV